MKWNLEKNNIPPVLLLHGASQEILWEEGLRIVSLLLSEKSQETDLFHFYPDTKRGLYSQEVVRKIIAETYLPPYRGECKCLVIHEVEKISAVGENALLKTLEESPPGVHFFLLATVVEMLLPTLRSRCFSFPVGKGAGSAVPLLSVEAHLEWLRSKDFSRLYQSLNGRMFPQGLEHIGQTGVSSEQLLAIHEFCNTQDLQGSPMFSTMAFLFHLEELS